MRFFERADDDQMRMDVFRRHSSYLEGIDAEIKVWTHENWDEWLAQDWFTEKVISRIPDEYVPKKELIKLFEFQKDVGFVREIDEPQGVVRKLFGGADVLNGPLEEERAILELKSAKGAKSRRKAHRLGSMTAKGGMW